MYKFRRFLAAETCLKMYYFGNNFQKSTSTVSYRKILTFSRNWSKFTQFYVHTDNCIWINAS